MDSIAKIMMINQEKKEFLEDYLSLNEMLLQAAESANTHDLQTMNQKKRNLAQAIGIIDEKIVAAIAALKADLNVKDLAEADSKRYPELKALKLEAASVLKLMVEAKRSDECLKEKIDNAYKQLKGSKRAMDLNRIGYYTQEYFKEEEV